MLCSFWLRVVTGGWSSVLALGFTVFGTGMAVLAVFLLQHLGFLPGVLVT